jgi:hypothetical protein
VTDGRLDAPINFKNMKQDSEILSFGFVDRNGDNDKSQMELTKTNSAKRQWVGLPRLPIIVKSGVEVSLAGRALSRLSADRDGQRPESALGDTP